MTMKWEWSGMGGRTLIAGLPPRQPCNCNCASALPLTSATAPQWRLGLGGIPALVAVPRHCHWHRPQPSGRRCALEAVPHRWLCLCIAIDIGRSPLMVVVPWRQSRVGGCASALPLTLAAALGWRLGLGGSPPLVVVPLHCHWHWPQPLGGGCALETVPHWWLCLCIAIDIGRSPLMVGVPWRQSRVGGCASALPLA
jgi:hypothetical protein